MPTTSFSDFSLNLARISSECPNTSNDNDEKTSVSTPNTSSIDGTTTSKRLEFRRFASCLTINILRVFLAETMGMFILMFCISGISASTVLANGQIGIMEYASTAGITVVVLIFSIGPISGAHINPSVTITCAIFGYFPWTKVPLYLLGQIMGSTSAAYVAKLVYKVNPEYLMTQPRLGRGSAFWVEFIAAFVLMLLTASLINKIHTIKHLAGFVIGLAVAMAVFITVQISGGSLNPARSLGPAIVAWNFKNIWIYIVAPVTGSIAGALGYHALCTENRNSNASCSSSSLYLIGEL